MKKLLFTLAYSPPLACLPLLAIFALILLILATKINTILKVSQSLASGVNQASAAAILRQNRADIYKFGLGSFGDTSDCYFGNVKNRGRIPALLNNGNISKATIRQIVNGNPLLQVDVYSTHIDVQPY